MKKLAHMLRLTCFVVLVHLSIISNASADILTELESAWSTSYDDYNALLVDPATTLSLDQAWEDALTANGIDTTDETTYQKTSTGLDALNAAELNTIGEYLVIYVANFTKTVCFSIICVPVLDDAKINAFKNALVALLSPDEGEAGAGEAHEVTGSLFSSYVEKNILLNDTLPDAFRHSYTTARAALLFEYAPIYGWKLMNAHEGPLSGNTREATYMDYHNNEYGYFTFNSLVTKNEEEIRKAILNSCFTYVEVTDEELAQEGISLSTLVAFAAVAGPLFFADSPEAKIEQDGYCPMRPIANLQPKLYYETKDEYGQVQVVLDSGESYTSIGEINKHIWEIDYQNGNPVSIYTTVGTADTPLFDQTLTPDGSNTIKIRVQVENEYAMRSLPTDYSEVNNYGILTVLINSLLF
ncbi:MAG: hypothetical protein OEX19_05890 [Gammaproteobacteria bacterium]|nr:hypothetical protein [Gammaproteobacteria bacterium]